jgi:hypothetical protein
MSIVIEGKKPSSELLALFADLKELMKKAEGIRAKGTDVVDKIIAIGTRDGWNDFQLTLLARHLLRDTFTKGQLDYWWPLRPKKQNNVTDEKQNLHNDDKKELEQTYIQSQDSRQLTEQMAGAEDLPVTKIVDNEPDYEAEYKKDKVYEESAKAFTKRAYEAVTELDENSLFDALKKRDDGISTIYWDHFGIKQWEGELSRLKNRGVKAFKRLYYEI